MNIPHYFELHALNVLLYLATVAGVAAIVTSPVAVGLWFCHGRRFRAFLAALGYVAAPVAAVWWAFGDFVPLWAAPLAIWSLLTDVGAMGWGFVLAACAGFLLVGATADQLIPRRWRPAA